MPKSASVITLSNGPTIISELEARHSAAEDALVSAGAALQNANARYDIALCEGREAAISARRLCTDAEVDLDIARRSVEMLTVQKAAAHDALRLADVEQKRVEAERLRSIFEQTARQHLSAMGISARTIIRAWAEAEQAIHKARQVEGPGISRIPEAESFRRVPRVERKEIRRTRIIRWLRASTGEAYPDHLQHKVIDQGSTGLMPGNGRDTGTIAERGEFDRITYTAATPSINVPLLIESLSVPALIAGQKPGWHPTGDALPHTVLAWLDDLERASAPKAADEETVDVFVCRVGAQ